MKAALQSRVPTLRLETPIPYELSSGIVTICLPGFISMSISQSLLEHERVLVSSLEKDSSLIRISTHVFNTDEEMDRLVTGLCRIQKSGY